MLLLNLSSGIGGKYIMKKRTFTIFFIAVLACLLLCGPLRAAILLDRVVAVVNNEVITWSELYKTMEMEASEQIRNLSDEEKKRGYKIREASLLERLIDIRLQIQEAAKLGFQVREEELKSAIESIKGKYGMTDLMFEESLKREGLTYVEYKKRLSEQIILSQFISQQIRSKIIISDEQINDLAKARGGNAEEEFRLRQIFFRKPKDDSSIQEIEEKAALVLRRLKSGEDFSVIGWEYSEDLSARTGGDLGYLKKGELAPEFASVLTGMKEGDISIPFWTGQGLHIIKLEEIRSAKGVEEGKAALKARLEEEAFAEKYKSYMNGLRARARIEIRL